MDKDLDNKELQNKLVSYIKSTALPEFLNGDYSYLSLIYDVFNYSDAIECHKLVAKEIYRIFCNGRRDII